MGKKKKPQTPNQVSAPSPRSNKVLSSPPTTRRNHPPPIESAVRLRVVSLSGATSSSSSSSSAISLSSVDAARLRVSSNDTVLILAIGSSGAKEDNNDKQQFTITSCTVAQVNVVHQPSRTTSSTPNSRKSPRKQGRLGETGCVGLSSARREQLWPAATTPTPPTTAANDNSPFCSTPSTPSTPDRPFSFSTPTTSSATKQQRQGQQHQSRQHECWVVAWDSPLGKRCQRAAHATVASSLTLELSDTDQTQQSSLMILERLLRATHAHAWVRRNETLVISYQGRSCSLTVSRVTSNKGLDQEFAQLDLNDDKDDNDKELESQLLSSLSLLGVQLFQITRETRIEIVTCASETNESQNTATANNNDNDNLQPTQYVAGLDHVVQQVRDHLASCFSRHYAPHVSPPRGLLLHGPCGAGKTNLARQVAATFDGRVQWVHAASLAAQTAVVGQAERALRQLFVSDSTQPTLLILDDVHLVAPRRGSGAGVDALTATLLALLDGIQSTSRLAVLAITHTPSLLDPAMRRPGRLDVEVEVPLPDEPGQRAAILQFHLHQMGVGSKLLEHELVDLAKRAKGYNGADCLLAVKEAIRLSMQREFVTTAKQPSIPPTVSFADMAQAMKSIRPTAIKALTVEIPQVLWSDIGGMEHVKENLREAIEMSQSNLYQQFRIPPPRGILLYGPPGTGKTMIARALATEGKMNFLAVKGPELLSKWLGESERALASLFRRARLASPSIIFFDEIDAIATRRGSSDSSSGSRMLSQLLTELDGVGRPNDDKGRVVVIGATNRPDLLDPALTRPGRIDRMVLVGLPDQPSREKVFQVALKGRCCDPDINLAYLSGEQVSGGYSGAEIVGICKEAALLALDESTHETIPSIQMRHLQAAIQATKRQITRAMLDFYSNYQTAT